MNIGTIKDLAGKQPVPQTPEVKAETKTASKVPSTETESVAEHAAEIHLSKTTFRQHSVKMLQQSMFEHMEKMTVIRQSSVQQQTSDISELRNLDITSAMKEAKPLFDFEEVAKNVLNFVGGALTGVASSGGSKEQLLEMLGQARTGVAKGIDDARKILGGLVEEGDDVDQGINKANSLITGGFDLFEQKINDPEDDRIFAYQSETVEQNVAFTDQRQGSFEINTKDGDKVSINFETLRQFKEHYEEQQQLVAGQGEEGSEFIYQSNQNINRAEFSFNDFALTIEGELDKDELKAIGSLLKDVSKLTDEFFNGDIEAAYKQAMELGYNDDEIAGYALDLSKTTSVQVNQAYQAYQNVAGYKPDAARQELPESVKKPLKDYAAELIEVVEKSDKQLESREELQNTVNALFSHQFKLSTEELFNALERFNHINQQIVNANENKPVKEDDVS